MIVRAKTPKGLSWAGRIAVLAHGRSRSATGAKLGSRQEVSFDQVRWKNGRSSKRTTSRTDPELRART